MKKIKTVAVLVVLMLASCEGGDNEKVFFKCLDVIIEEKKEYINYEDGEDYVSDLIRFEQELKEVGYLEAANKEGYEKLIDKVIESEGKYKSFLENSKSDIFAFKSLINQVLFQCPLYCIENSDEEFLTMKRQYSQMEKIEYHGFNKKEYIKELFKVTDTDDFDNFLFRIPFIYLFIVNAEGW
ncbi:hypothetical protein ACFQ1M_17335 [Sungkyunkwania multivorans]|uniref:Lipoprotein n=1 Tax=Sungkyunkwania multivorans TaxID=1173618 RepID=A0ABW3D1M7_9FLAO